MTASSIIAAAAVAPCRPWPRHVLTAEEWSAMATALDAEPSLELLALWADQAQVHALFHDAQTNRILPASVGTIARGYGALSPHRRAAIWFERMIRDLWGHAANGARDVRPLLDHGRWSQAAPLAARPAPLAVTPAAAEFLPVEADDHHQIPLGPVFGGIGEPNEYAMKWFDEFLYYYTNYGIYQVLNINAGTILIGFLAHRLGINNEFKISVFVGTDNAYFILWTLMMAKLFARQDGTTPLIGFNLSNSVNTDTIEATAKIRKSFGFENVVRIEHHITEAYKHIVRQPYERRTDLLKLADHVKNISAKHEGGDPEIEATRQHPSDILEYFLPKSEVESKGLMPLLLANYMDKHAALNRTAEELTKQGLAFVAAKNLHKKH
jgi:hypothetical protein